MAHRNHHSLCARALIQNTVCLGLSFRARHLVAMSQELVEYHRGVVPRRLEDLLRLTGVGEYCARALLSFAYNEDVPIVDTNVGRFLYRLNGLPGPLPVNPSRKKNLLEMASELLPRGQSKDFNLAVLDLCADICKRSKPKCDICPVQGYCHYGTRDG